MSFLFNQSESTAARRVAPIQMVLASDHMTAATGKTLTVTILKPGATSYEAIAGTSTEVSDGTYKISLAAADLNTCGEAMLKITADACDTQFVPISITDELSSIREKTDTLGAATVTIASSVAAGGEVTIYSGAAASLAFTVSDWTGSSLSGASATFGMVTAANWKAGTTTPALTASAACTQSGTTVSIAVSLSAGETGTLTPSTTPHNYRWQIYNGTTMVAGAGAARNSGLASVLPMIA